MTSDPGPLPTHITTVLDGYFAGEVLMACTRLKVYTKCAETPQEADTLAARCDVQPGWMQLLLDANVTLGLLEHTAEGYRSTPLAQTYLNEQKHGALTNLIKFADAEEVAAWTRLADIVRGRETPPDFAPELETDHRKARALGKATYNQLLGDAKKCAQFCDARNVIDLGNGLAPLGLVALQQNAEARVRVIDWPSYETPLNKTVTHAGYRERMTFIGGDPVEACPRDGDADLVCLGGVLSRVEGGRRTALLSAAASALRPGGQLHAQEYVTGAMPDTHTALARLRTAMLFGPDSGTPLDREGVLDMLAAAGFVNVVLLPIPDSSMTCITAERTRTA